MARWCGSCRGQMSVEAALLLPTVLLLVAFLVQPACVLYTRSAMASTALELARVMATARCSDEEVRTFALRRLSSVPTLSIFHEGGDEDWEIEASEGEGRVTVRIAGRVRPLPVLGVLASAFGETSGGCVVMRVEAEQDVRADWVGGNYEDWIGIWG